MIKYRRGKDPEIDSVKLFKYISKPESITPITDAMI